ncbi:MAG: hypothetical protein WDN28_10100 [Chthoniobacter sp.]
MKSCTLFLIVVCGFSLMNAAEPKKTSSDPVLSNYQPELDRARKDYEERVRTIRKRMLSDYESAERTAITAKDLDQANALKIKIQELQLLLANDLRIVGKWNVTQSNNVTATWTFNKDNTYNYWNETGEWKYAGAKYLLKHTWDWELSMTDDNTIDGICIRGEKGVKLHGVRAQP